MAVFQRFPAVVTRATVLTAVVLLLLTTAAAEDPAPMVRVLLLTGRNNHNWSETTPKLQHLLQATGKFAVDTTVPPNGLTRDNLQNYDVILSNWNSWGDGSKQTEAEWTDEVRRAYLDFVRAGRGHGTIHAGGSSFYEGWPEYRRVTLMYWNLGTTGHGRQHEFKVRIDRPDHALTAGLRGFTVRDELWNKPGVVEGATVLASAFSTKRNEARGTDQWESSMVVAHYGQGRCFATLLGHDVQSMDSDGFRQLLIRGVEWAATGETIRSEQSTNEAQKNTRRQQP